MSTGLTYVYIGDIQQLVQPVGGVSFVFSSYQEAYTYGEWICLRITSEAIAVYIWTSGPNNNGYWLNEGGIASFTIQD